MKKSFVVPVVLLVLCLILSSCSLLPGSTLESLFRPDESSVISGSGASESSDTVTVSRQEYEQMSRFSEMFDIYNSALENFYQDVDESILIEYATRGLMAGLKDPYSYYYNPEEFAQMWEDDEGSYVGIGVMISANMETQICTISRVFKGGPAEEAGVLRGDILYCVGEDLFVTATNLQEAVDCMRGEPDTDVDVTFIRNGEQITYTIPRRQVNVNQVESCMLDDRVGYIALYEFSGQCDKEFEEALNRLLDNHAEGILIDLRDNPGGWVDQARNIADLFMDEGELCYLQYRDGEQHSDEYRTTNGKADVKLVILINENSASSSEILTGALRECADALTVGVKSFGKGIIQGVFPVGNSGAGYQMTIAQYFTPKGSAVHQIGIDPDYEVPLPEDDTGMYEFADLDHDVQLSRAYEVMCDILP
jgi:C-terminal peptidase (prc)